MIHRTLGINFRGLRVARIARRNRYISWEEIFADEVIFGQLTLFI